MTSYQKEFKVLHAIYKIVLIILFLFAAFIFYQKKTVFSVSNFLFSDYLILVSLIVGLLIVFGANKFIKNKISVINNYKGLFRTKVKMLIDASVVNMILLEFPIIMNLLFFKKTNNLLYVILGLFFLIYFIKSKPNHKIVNRLSN